MKPIINFPLRDNVNWDQVIQHCPDYCTLRIPGGAFAMRNDIEMDEVLDKCIPKLRKVIENRPDIDFIWVIGKDAMIHERAKLQRIDALGRKVYVQLFNEPWLPRYEKTWNETKDDPKDSLYTSPVWSEITPEKYLRFAKEYANYIGNRDYILSCPFPNSGNTQGQLRRLTAWTENLLSGFDEDWILSIHVYEMGPGVDLDTFASIVLKADLTPSAIWLTEHALPEKEATELFEQGLKRVVVEEQSNLWRETFAQFSEPSRWGVHTLYQEQGWGLISKDGPTSLMDVFNELTQTKPCEVNYIGTRWIRDGWRWSRHYVYEVTKDGSTERITSKTRLDEDELCR